MSYSYNRQKTAAKMDFFQEWKDIVDKNEEAVYKDFDALLKKAVPYLRSVGYDLILNKSYLARRHRGSDGWGIEGTLVIKEREENNVQSPNTDSVKKWINEALDLSSSVRKLQEGPDKDRYGDPLVTWEVDISSY